MKVGSSLIVDPNKASAKRSWLKRLADDIADLHRAGADVLVVSSGAVALGRSVLGFPRGALKLEEARRPPRSARSPWRVSGQRRCTIAASSPGRCW